MMNGLDSSNKSDYYIGMSIPSRQSEFTPNCVINSETILDYDEANPPPQNAKRKRPRPTDNHSLSSHNSRSNHRQVYDIKEEDEELSISEEQSISSEHSGSNSNEEDDDILENDEYAYDEDSDDLKRTHHTPQQSYNSNNQSKPNSNSHPQRNSNHSGAIDEDAEYTQIQALQEQLQQQQRQLVLQSNQLKQLKHQIKEQNDDDIPNIPHAPQRSSNNIPQNNGLKAYHFEHEQPYMSSDSNGSGSHSPFPTLAFDENQHDSNGYVQQSNPNLAKPMTNRTIHTMEQGSFRQQTQTHNKPPRSPRLPKNPFSQPNSQKSYNSNHSNSSPRKRPNAPIQPPNAFVNQNNVTNTQYIVPPPHHTRSHSGSSHKSRKKKKSQKRNPNRTSDMSANTMTESSHTHTHSSKSKSNRRSNKSKSHKSHSNHSSLNQIIPKSPRKGSRKRKSKERERNSNSLSKRSHKSSVELVDHNQKLNRKQLNMNYSNVNEQNTQTHIHNRGLSPRSHIHSPPMSIGDSPPLSVTTHHINHANPPYSDDGHSERSYSKGTTGQHKLADIALPSTFYTSECNDPQKIITNINGSGSGSGSGNVVDLFMNPLKEIELSADNLNLHNKKLAKNLKPYHYHQHQHQHLHHHHYITNNHNNGGTAADIVNGKSGKQHLGMNQFGISGLSMASTESQMMTKIFHPTNRMRSMFQDKKGKPNLPINPESQYSTAAALDPLDELDNMDVLNNYDKHKELGNGTDAFVYEVVDRRDKSHVAMKLTKRKSGRYKTEIHLLHQLRNCPYVVKLLNCLENDNVYVLILEHAPMSLENLLLQRCTKHPMQERVAKTILSQILKGIRAIHNLGFVHKDIKPENILIFANRSERKLIAKVADFGFATRVSPEQFGINQLPREKYIEFEKHVRDRCGTPGFWPPELVTSLCALRYAFKMDVFSAGVTLYRMLCNEMPFGIFESWKYNIDHRDGQKKLCKVKPNWKVISWIQTDNKYTPVLSSRKLSDIVKDLLRSMLRIRPEQRAGVDHCLAHHFFTNKKQKNRNRSHHNSTGNAMHSNRRENHLRNASQSNTYSSTHQRDSSGNSKHNRKKRSHNSNSNISHRKYQRHSNRMKAKG